ncbi:tRNA dihydrouridine synthase DusB [bacterium]|nr:MAG: tRNA dihydrouridine synthase DusB [bacterium]
MTHSLFSLNRKVVISAPMAGYSDTIYRRFARRYGADLTFTEMISAEGFLRDSTKTMKMLYHSPDEEPIGAQFFSGNPDAVEFSARKVSSMGFSVFDINMGCPVRKVLKNGAGAALLKNLKWAEKVIKAAMCAPIPISIKIRSGFSSSECEWENILKFLARVEKLGISFITIHPRTATQFFAGKANWKLIAEAVKNLKIPVIASGDIFSIEDVVKVIELTDAAGVMIARGALSNFQLFRQAKKFFEGENPVNIEKISVAERGETMLEFIEEEIKYRGEERAIRWCRKFLVHLLTGFPGARQLRERMNKIEKFSTLEREVFKPLFENF